MRKKESTRTEGRSRNPRHKVVRRGEPLFRSLVHQDYTPRSTTYGTSGVTISVQHTNLCRGWRALSCANSASRRDIRRRLAVHDIRRNGHLCALLKNTADKAKK
jgi:hypothetical protein